MVLTCMVWLLVGLLSTAEYAQHQRLYWDFDAAKVRGFTEGPQRDDIVPGEFLIDPPTLENLGFRWYIEGDSNRNARVEVAYRQQGESQWRDALPMHRVHHEVVTRVTYNGNYRHYRTGNLFAGSVMGLRPATTYEVRVTMTDPDGGAPAEPKVVTVTTRTEPRAFEQGRTLHVYPQDHPDPRRQADVYDTIPAAYQAARPGDVILLHEGVHQAEGAPYLLTKSGEPGKPIVFRGMGANKSIIQGPDLETDLFYLSDADYLMFEDLGIRRFRTAIATGTGRRYHDAEAPGASWLTVQRCHIDQVLRGVWTYSWQSANWYIADNVFTGIREPAWYPRLGDGRYMDGSHTAVNVYGSGHVICHNRIDWYSDGVAINNIHASDDYRRHAVNIDIYNNDISEAMDDGIEADYGAHNIRVYRNRIYNAHTALSVQPAYGGPIYLIRNEAFGITALNLKWNNQVSGAVAYHNTLATAGNAFNTPLWSNGHLRNNLLLGNGHLITSGTFTPDQTTMDYNGYRGAMSQDGNLIRWSSNQAGRQNYDSLQAFYAATGYEQHGILINYDSFVQANPVERGRDYVPGDFDLRLVPTSPAVDAGVRLPNINDDYTGSAPDLGAFELGQDRPQYGPRPR